MIVEPPANALTWIDGEFIPWHAANMHVSDNHYAVGVFEGVRSYTGERGTTIFRLKDHTKRLFRSAHMLKMKIPNSFDEASLNHAQIELLRRNSLQDSYLRPFIFHSGLLGISPRVRGLRIRVAVLALEWRDDGAFGEEIKTRGIRLRTSSYTQHHASSMLVKAKANGNYMSGILAREEAQDCGADEALMLDRDGFVTETCGANIFALLRGQLCTPPLDSVLEGVTRDTVIALAKSLGMTVIERRLTRDDIYSAEEAFLTGTAAEITAVRELDGRAIGTGKCGEITTGIQTAYQNLVRRREDRYPEWFTAI